MDIQKVRVGKELDGKRKKKESRLKLFNFNSRTDVNTF